MTYTRPKDVTITAMCIYIDDHIYNGDYSEELVFEYLYHIVYSLSCKDKFFSRFEDYDAFALFCATKIFMRLIDKRQFSQIPGEKYLKKIKSVLNYIKTLLYPLRVDYQNEYFAEVIDPSVNKKIDGEAIAAGMKQGIIDSNKATLPAEFEDTLGTIVEEVRKVVRNTPYRSDKIKCKRIYLSCLLTLLKEVTLNNYNKSRIEKRNEKNVENSSLLIKMYAQEREDSTTLWHLPDHMSTYIKMLCNKIKKNLSESLSFVLSSYEISESTLNDIMMSAYETPTGVDWYD